MYAFEYHRPESVEAALSLLQGAEDGKLMAGGQTLIPTLKQRLAQPSDVIDLGGLKELVGICEDGDALVVGAMTTHGAVAEDALVKAQLPALASLAEGIGDPQVRNRGTLAGSIANNDPAADYPGAVVGLNATVKTNRREIAADDFFTGMFETALDEDELILSVRFPRAKRAAYAKFPNPASRYAMVGAFVAELADGSVRVAITGAAACVFRWTDAEQALAGGLDAAKLDQLSVDAEGLNSDMHGSAAYRAHLVKVMTKRALAALG
jgi:carbon-monoxide dehydrogenase medium subunit